MMPESRKSSSIRLLSDYKTSWYNAKAMAMPNLDLAGQAIDFTNAF
jgi:hypothetical protein